MPVTLTLPLGLERRLSARHRRWRRITVGVLIALGVALLAAGFLLPAKAGSEIAPCALSSLTIGDALTLERRGGSTAVYEVVALDVVDSRRVELQPEPQDGVVVLVARWPLDTTSVGGDWRFVLTARQRF
jgi:hypothetical protein